jgi:hypothetical protein
MEYKGQQGYKSQTVEFMKNANVCSSNQGNAIEIEIHFHLVKSIFYCADFEIANHCYPIKIMNFE